MRISQFFETVRRPQLQQHVLSLPETLFQGRFCFIKSFSQHGCQFRQQKLLLVRLSETPLTNKFGNTYPLPLRLAAQETLEFFSGQKRDAFTFHGCTLP